MSWCLFSTEKVQVSVHLSNWLSNSQKRAGRWLWDRTICREHAPSLKSSREMAGLEINHQDFQ